MTNKDFEHEVSAQMKRCSDLLLTKGEGYKGNSVEDRLNHFKVAAGLMESDQKLALLGMWSKHVASVAKMCSSGEEYPLEVWDEKITDSINYLLILSAMVREKSYEEHRTDNIKS